MKQYRNRIYDTVLWHRLEAKGAVLVGGAEMVRENNDMSAISTKRAVHGTT
mgnify:CR=1 FL=1